MTQRAKVTVRLTGGAYDALNAPGLLARVGQELCRLTPARKACIVTDSQVGPLYLPRVRESLAAAGFEVIDATIPAGEDHKTLADLLPVYDRLLRHRIDRN